MGVVSHKSDVAGNSSGAEKAPEVAERAKCKARFWKFKTAKERR
jgi:hypothetical protein